MNEPIKKYFVILRQHNDLPVPMVEEDKTLALFDSEDDADNAGNSNPLGEAYGWITFVWIVE